MPTIIHSIGDFYFISMTPCPPLRRRKVFTETRAGVDGYAVWYDAVRGEVWRPRTVVDAPSFYGGELLKEQYELACGQDPVPIVYANSQYPRAVIKDVQVHIRAQQFGIGGYNAIAKALVYANWDILIL